ncbi:class I SAM-dependent methyltransferase [Desulfurispira natronophila]|uniref:SAM-dependent methyltransferase n=1 Tax=Desulfurispira natronophila TaxID=682562 RepID=A0A7W7Y428_9BACT|nr:class I SAM-dependent methyltransferase [Desulfurispira natronophila]MBB5021716.1 SAM-dependent methyltransferase [Desulfurispira natronophila]
MEQDRKKWNERYRTSPPGQEPLELVNSYARLVKTGGLALDVACGLGRHSILLADIGFTVEAVDISDVAVEELNKSNHPHVFAKQVDLDHYAITPGNYDLIVTVNFLQRKLFAPMIAGLKPGGILIYRSFMYSDQNQGAPMTRQHLLEENELLHAFCTSLRILHYREFLSVRQRWGQAWVAELVGQLQPVK